MDLASFFRASRQIDVFEVISFANLPPQLIGLKIGVQTVGYVGSRIVEIEERDEFGIIEFLPADRAFDESVVSRETFAGGALQSTGLLSLPNRASVSGLSLTFERGVVVHIASGSMPFSIFFERDGLVRGHPELPLENYVRLS